MWVAVKTEKTCEVKQDMMCLRRTGRWKGKIKEIQKKASRKQITKTRLI